MQTNIQVRIRALITIHNIKTPIKSDNTTTQKNCRAGYTVSKSLYML